MHVLQVVGGLPSAEHPSYQPFVASQIESVRNQGVLLDILDLSKIHFSGWIKYFKGILELRNRISFTGYDLIHAHYSYCGFVAVFQKSVPVIVSLMGSDLLGTPDVNGALTVRGRADKAAAKLLARFVDHIIVKSDEMAAALPFENKVSVIPNGVDLALFKPVDRKLARGHFNIDEKQKVILFAGDPGNSRKNYQLAEGALHLLKGIIGPDCMLLPFRKHAQSEVPLAMSAADALIMTSFWEGSPNVVKEAMACNLPIVSVKVGDVPAIIAGTKNCHIGGYDPNDLAEKLARVIQSGERSNGRERIEWLSLDNVARRVVDTYSKVITTGAAKA